MSIQEIHNFINFIKDTEVNGYSSPAEIDAALDRASLALFAERLLTFALNERAQNDLAPFKTQYFFTPTSTPSGVITLPDDYMHLLSINGISYDNINLQTLMQEVDIPLDDEVAERLRSQLNPVNELNPVVQRIGAFKIQLYPKKPNTGEIWYLKRPDKPLLAFNQVGRTLTYDPTGSVQLEWNEINMNKVIFAALANLGINMSNEQMVQYSELRKQDA